MPEHATLAAALCAAQAEMPNAVLDKVNPHFKNRYASLESIRAASLPSLTKHGISISHYMDTDLTRGFHLKGVLKHATSGETSEPSCYPLPNAPDKPQVMASAITYGRRYTWAGLIAIAAEEDDDAEIAQGTHKVVNPATGRMINPRSAHQARQNNFYPRAEEEIRSAVSLTALKNWWITNWEEIQKLPPHWQTHLDEEKDRRKLELADEIGDGPVSSERLRASIVLSEEEKAVIDPPDVTTDDPKAFLDELAATLSGAKDMTDLMAIWAEWDGIKGVLPVGSLSQAQMIYEQNYRRLKADEVVKLMKDGKKK